MFYYEFYGIRISSEIELPVGLKGIEELTQIDLSFSLNKNTIEPPSNKEFTDFIKIQESEHIYVNSLTGEYRLSADGKCVYFSRFVNCSSIKAIGACFVGIVLPYILQYKGLIPMHSSGLVFNNKSFGLMAGPGVGKSTAQVLFLNKGFNFFTDDVLPLTLKHHQVLAYPGYPALKLDPKSISKGKFIKKGTLLTESSSKYLCTIEENRICKTPTTLGGIFYLCPEKEENKEIAITKITGQEKLIVLLTNVFTLSIINDKSHIRYLESFSSSAFSKVPLYKVEYHRTMDQLNEVIEKIINIIRKQEEV